MYDGEEEEEEEEKVSDQETMDEWTIGHNNFKMKFVPMLRV